MGKSDPFIFHEYFEALSHVTSPVSTIAFLGFQGENHFTRRLPVYSRDFYDRALGNWDINSDWVLPKTYDLIVCTRCAYFSKNPVLFIEKCKAHLNNGGFALIDWGLGDHWRFEKFKIGWVKDDEHEFAYHPDNFLHSCFWNDDLKSDVQAMLFWEHCQKLGYYHKRDTLESVIRNEVPSIVDYPCEHITTRFLWPESPQLYIITLVKNELFVE